MEIIDKKIDGGKAFDWGKTSSDYAKYRDIYPQDFYDKIVSRKLCIKGQNVLEPVFLTKNGYGAMVVLSLEAYSRLTDGVEAALDEADGYASENEKRYTHEEVFSNLRRRVKG